MEFKEYVIQQLGEENFNIVLKAREKQHLQCVCLEDWFPKLYNTYRTQFKNLKIIVKRLDPCGTPIETQELDTILNFPWVSNPIETEAGIIHAYEERRKWRCLIQIGNYEYIVHRDGELEKLGGFKGGDK